MQMKKRFTGHWIEQRNYWFKRVNCRIVRAKPGSFVCHIWRDAMLKLFRDKLNNFSAAGFSVDFISRLGYLVRERLIG